MKASRSHNSSNGVVKLQGSELERLIEAEGSSSPPRPREDSSGVAVRPEDATAPVPISSPSCQTGPGMAASVPSQRTERIRSEPEVSPRPTQENKPAVSPRGASQPRSGKRRTRSEGVIDELLGRCLGSYRILSLIGEGGMGRVYLAEHTKLGRKVALKLLRAEYALRQDAVKRFFQEARAVNQIGHQNIVDITDFVELDTGQSFFIMEMLQGEDLADIQRGSSQPMPLHRAMQIALQVCEALEAAHRAGIIHRDLKPDNIFIVNDGNRHDFVKLLDFGVAKLLGSESNPDTAKTLAGSVIGTPAYMSPEQAAGIAVDHRSDIYSLGAILYELFTGHPVFRAKSFGEFVIKHMNDLPVPPRELADAPRIPAALEAVILRCLEKDPARRYQSAAELREDLARATATVQTALRPVDLGAPPREAPAARKRRRPMIVLVTVVLATTLLAGGAFWLAAGLDVDDHTAPPSAPTAGGTLTNSSPAKSRGVSTRPIAPESSKVVSSAKLTLRSRPNGAEVFRQDAPSISLGKTPLELRLENVGAKVEFVFRLPGYKTKTAPPVEIQDNTLVAVDLEQLEEQALAPAPSRASTAHRRSESPKSREGSSPAASKTSSAASKTSPAASKTSPAAKTKAKKAAPRTIDSEDQLNPFEK